MRPFLAVYMLFFTGLVACATGVTPTASPGLIFTPIPSPTAEEASGLAPNLTVEVVRVVDGDTVDVVFPDGSSDRVRLLGVDTPETHLPNKPFEYGDITDTACLDEWGNVATQFAVENLAGQMVTVILDPVAGERGSYGRLLAYLHVDGQDFNAALVELGLARVYTEGDSSREGGYLQLQAHAQANDIGLWQCREAPGVIRVPTAIPGIAPSGAAVVIECIFYDGLMPRTEADEYVQIVNVGDSPVNLGGWALVDVSEGYPKITFSPYIIEPGERIRVYTNGNHPEWGGFSFGYGRAVWNNREPDVAALLDSSGQEVSRKSYPPGC